MTIFFHIYLGEQQQQQPQKGRKHKPEVNGQSSSSSCTSSSLPAVAAYQRHELTLLRMEDLLNHGSGSEAAPLQNLGVSGRVQTAAELCHRMVDFCQRLTTAKRKILEDPDLYPEVRYSTSRHKLWVLVSLTWYFYKRNSNFLYYFSPVLSIFLHCIIIFAYRSKF